MGGKGYRDINEWRRAECNKEVGDWVCVADKKEKASKKKERVEREEEMKKLAEEMERLKSEKIYL